jgi:hypothetical protein
VPRTSRRRDRRSAAGAVRGRCGPRPAQSAAGAVIRGPVAGPPLPAARGRPRARVCARRTARGGYLRRGVLEFDLAAAPAGEHHAALGGGHAAPHSVRLRLQQGVLTAFGHHRAAGADTFGRLLPGKPSSCGFLGGREEQPRFVTAAGGLRVPGTAQVPGMPGVDKGIRDGLDRLKHGKLLTTARRLPRLPVADRPAGQRGLPGQPCGGVLVPLPAVRDFMRTVFTATGARAPLPTCEWRDYAAPLAHTRIMRSSPGGVQRPAAGPPARVQPPVAGPSHASCRPLPPRPTARTSWSSP